MADTASAVNQFVNECQTVSERGIQRMEAQMLWTFDALIGELDTTAFPEYDFTVPALPPIPNFTSSAYYREDQYLPHTNHVWAAQQMADLQTAIFSAIGNGGIGISDALQTAMFNSDRERKIQALNDSLTAVSAGFGARGFRLPNSMLTGARNEIIQKYQFDLENQSREILKLIEEHARTNWQFCIQNGIDSEKFHAGFTNQYDQMFIEMIKANLERYRLELSAELDKYKANLEAIRQQLEVHKLKIEAGNIGTDAVVKKLRIDLDRNIAAASAAVNSKQAETARINTAMTSYHHMVQNYANTASAGLIQIIK